MTTSDLAPVPVQDRIRMRARTQLLADDTRLVLRLGRRAMAIEPFDELVERLLWILAEPTSPVTALDLVAGHFGPEGRARAQQLLADLSCAGVLEHCLEPPGDLTTMQLARLSRLIDFFSEFETPDTSRFDFIRRLTSARVAVLGIGGLGSWIVYNLMCMGVGELLLIDGDRVEPSNLNRAILYTQSDTGRLKVEAARDTITRFAPETTVDVHNGFVDGPSMLRPLLDGVDLLVSCADQPPVLIREWVATAARGASVPCLAASGTRLGPFYLPGRTSCPMCDWARQVEDNPRLPRIMANTRRLPRGNSGSLSALATMAAAPAALDIFRFLSGYLPPRTVDAVLRFDGATDTTLVPTPRHPQCQVCGSTDRKDHHGIH